MEEKYGLPFPYHCAMGNEKIHTINLVIQLMEHNHHLLLVISTCRSQFLGNLLDSIIFIFNHEIILCIFYDMGGMEKENPSF